MSQSLLKQNHFLKDTETTVNMERKQYHLVLVYAITIHKSQGSALEYILGHLNCTTNKGAKAAPANWGQVYALFPCAISWLNQVILN